jgi:phosphatidate cytidylyltransferase
MFKTRLLSGIVLVIAALVLIITGGDVLLISTLIISYIGMFELYRIFHIEKEAVGIIGYLAATAYYCNLKFAFLPDTMVFVLGVLILMMFAYVFTYPKYKTEQVLAAFFGVFYVAVMLSYVYQTRMIEAGAYIVWLVFLCSWGCDTCAYCVGMLIGKHKMSPKLSPKKSVEGAVGGVAGAALLPQVGQDTTSTPPLRSPSVFKINLADLISSDGSPVRETLIVSPIPWCKINPSPMADLILPLIIVPASVIPTCSG